MLWHLNHGFHRMYELEDDNYFIFHEIIDVIDHQIHFPALNIYNEKKISGHGMPHNFITV